MNIFLSQTPLSISAESVKPKKSSSLCWSSPLCRYSLYFGSDWKEKEKIWFSIFVSPEGAPMGMRSKSYRILERLIHQIDLNFSDDLGTENFHLIRSSRSLRSVTISILQVKKDTQVTEWNKRRQKMHFEIQESLLLGQRRTSIYILWTTTHESIYQSHSRA